MAAPALSQQADRFVSIPAASAQCFRTGCTGRSLAADWRHSVSRFRYPDFRSNFRGRRFFGRSAPDFLTAPARRLRSSSRVATGTADRMAPMRLTGEISNLISGPVPAVPMKGITLVPSGICKFSFAFALIVVSRSGLAIEISASQLSLTTRLARASINEVEERDHRRANSGLRLESWLRGRP